MLQNRLRVVRCNIMPGSGDKWRALTVPKLFRSGISRAPAGEVKVICRGLHQVRAAIGRRAASRARDIFCTKKYVSK